MIQNGQATFYYPPLLDINMVPWLSTMHVMSLLAVPFICCLH